MIIDIEQIKEEIRDGDYKLVAKRAGVHYNTVVNHIHGKHKTRFETEKRLINAWAEIINERRAWRAELKRRLNY